MFTPFKVRGLTLKNRIAVSPMAQYSAVDGVAGDYHLAHLGARALGGAALVFAEMTCVSADARITPYCPACTRQNTRRPGSASSISSTAQRRRHRAAAGPRGRQRLHARHVGRHRPAAGQGNWPLVSASPQQYLQGMSQTAREMTAEDMDRIQADFVRATLAADEAGFDWLELHCAHGYLLSSFISPLTNQRTTNTAAAWKTAAATRCACSPPCAPPGRSTSR
jgi:anthraniloyl-CoA monooxygenase